MWGCGLQPSLACAVGTPLCTQAELRVKISRSLDGFKECNFKKIQFLPRSSFYLDPVPPGEHPSRRASMATILKPSGSSSVQVDEQPLLPFSKHEVPRASKPERINHCQLNHLVPRQWMWRMPASRVFGHARQRATLKACQSCQSQSRFVDVANET